MWVWYISLVQLVKAWLLKKKTSIFHFLGARKVFKKVQKVRQKNVQKQKILLLTNINKWHMVFHIFFLNHFWFFWNTHSNCPPPYPLPYASKKMFFLAKLVHIYDVEEVKKYLEKKPLGFGVETPPPSHPIVIRLTIYVHCTVCRRT